MTAPEFPPLWVLDIWRDGAPFKREIYSTRKEARRQARGFRPLVGSTHTYRTRIRRYYPEEGK